MAMQYINYLKAKTHISTAEKSDAPVLSEEDEKFLNQITSQDDARSTDAQIALMDGSQNIPLPASPPEETKRPILETPTTGGTEVTENEGGSPSKSSKRSWSWLRRDSRDAQRKKQEATAASLMDVAEGLKNEDAKPNEDGQVEDKEAKKEEEEMTIALERLNLAAVNNRVFSVSHETQELFQKFTIIFKDLINGVPTAYDDLERLLTNSDRQLQSTFKSLPGFLQKLIESLPNKMTSSFAPEIMAVAAERAQRSGVNMENAGKAAAAAQKMGFKAPSLKDMIGKPGALAGMLRSIIQFLRARFPAFMGMNVLWSLALFILLIVLWYCHKRGRDVRLDKERDLTEQEVARLDVEHRAMHENERLTTTADEGASAEEIRAGIDNVRRHREAARRSEGPPQSSPDLDAK